MGRGSRRWGQFVGAVIMFFVLGFIPGYVLSWILKQAGLLRVPREVELAGLDYMNSRDDESRGRRNPRRPCGGDRAGARQRRGASRAIRLRRNE